MDFAGMNYVAVLVATVAAFIFGAVWYGLLSEPWMKAAHIDPTSVRMSTTRFITNFAAELVIAWALAGIIGHLDTGQVTLWDGIVSGIFVWLGFMATTTIVNQSYQGFDWELTFIDAGHWLGVALLMGAIIGWFGVPATG